MSGCPAPEQVSVGSCSFGIPTSTRLVTPTRGFAVDSPAPAQVCWTAWMSVVVAAEQAGIARRRVSFGWQACGVRRRRAACGRSTPGSGGRKTGHRRGHDPAQNLQPLVTVPDMVRRASVAACRSRLTSTSFRRDSLARALAQPGTPAAVEQSRVSCPGPGPTRAAVLYRRRRCSCRPPVPFSS
jgi:hypothetical protein